MPPTYRRYVAIGDSSTEGLDDPDGAGGYRGWSRRLAERLAAARDGELLYANLAIRGRRTRQIREEQLAPALAMAPDLVTLFCGTNDAVARHFDVAAFAADLEHLQAALVASGATVLGFTMPRMGPVVPTFARWLEPRIAALNDAIRTVSRRTGALVVDFAEHPIGSDPRLWSADRLHANALGHGRMAAALAWRLGLPDCDASWADPLPAAPPTTRARRLADELRWWRTYLLPWLVRHARGRSSGDGLTASCPDLVPFATAELVTRPRADRTVAATRGP